MRRNVCSSARLMLIFPASSIQRTRKIPPPIVSSRQFPSKMSLGFFVAEAAAPVDC